AIRIFAELAFRHPARWTALAFLVDGIRAYRRTMGTTKEARLNLLAAEQHFLNAITEDNRFDLAHYNLGVVYTALDRPMAARNAFVRSVELNPLRFDSQYALARVLYIGAAGQKTMAAHVDLRLALDHCDQALALQGDAEGRAKTLNQKAIAQQEVGLNQKAIDQQEVGPEDFFGAAEHCRAAVRAAFRSLLGAELAVFQRPEKAQRRRTQARDLA